MNDEVISEMVLEQGLTPEFVEIKFCRDKGWYVESSICDAAVININTKIHDIQQERKRNGGGC